MPGTIETGERLVAELERRGDGDRYRSRVLAAVVGDPWAILPAKLELLHLIVADRLEHGREAAGLRLRLGDQAPREPYAIQRVDGRGVAVVPVHGVISKRAGMFTEVSGGTSTEKLVADVRAAMEDPNADAVVLDVDSPGGAAASVPAAAADLFALRGRKPFLASANDLAASAAYWIGSAADGLYVSPGGTVGSIGVVTVHYDQSRAYEAAGVRPTVLTAGKLKAAGSELKPLSEGDREYIQSRLDAIYSDFVGAVAKNRGTSTEAVRERMADGRVFLGRSAVEVGLADGVAGLEEVVRKAADAAKGKVSVSSSTTPAAPAPADNPAPAVPAAAAPAAAPAIAVDTVTRSAHDAAIAAAVQAERSRAVDILGLCAIGGNAKLAAMYVGDGSSVAMVRAHVMAGQVAANPAVESEPSGNGSPTLSGDAALSAEYEKNAAVYALAGMTRDEYVDARKANRIAAIAG